MTAKTCHHKTCAQELVGVYIRLALAQSNQERAQKRAGKPGFAWPRTVVMYYSGITTVIPVMTITPLGTTSIGRTGKRNQH